MNLSHICFILVLFSLMFQNEFLQHAFGYYIDLEPLFDSSFRTKGVSKHYSLSDSLKIRIAGINENKTILINEKNKKNDENLWLKSLENFPTIILKKNNKMNSEEKNLTLLNYNNFYSTNTKYNYIQNIGTCKINMTHSV